MMAILTVMKFFAPLQSLESIYKWVQRASRTHCACPEKAGRLFVAEAGQAQMKCVNWQTPRCYWEPLWEGWMLFLKKIGIARTTCKPFVLPDASRVVGRGITMRVCKPNCTRLEGVNLFRRLQ